MFITTTFSLKEDTQNIPIERPVYGICNLEAYELQVRKQEVFRRF